MCCPNTVNESPIEKQRQKDALEQIQTTRNANAEAAVDSIPAEQQETAQSAHAENLAALREMEANAPAEPLQMAEPVFTRNETSYRQQKRRHENSKKSARNQATENLMQEDQRRLTELRHTENSQPNSLEELQYASFLRIQDGDIGSYQRVDPTGHQRRKRAAANSKKVGVSAKKAMTADLDNLVNNLRKDLYLEGKFEPDPRMEKFFEAYLLSDLIVEHDTRLQKEIYYAKHPEQQRPADLPPETRAPEAVIQENKRALSKVQDLSLFIKNAGSQAGLQIESFRLELKAMHLAHQQLVEDGESAYNAALLTQLDDRIEAKNAQIELLIDDFHNAAGGAAGEAAGIAKVNAVIDLSRLHREMKAREADDPNARTECRERAKEIIRSFDY